MATIYVDVIPTLLENTTMRKRVTDGVDKTYQITPIEGYLLHDSRADDIDYDEEGNVINVTLRYKSSTSSCTIVQFNNNTYDIYAVPADSVPADSILSEPGNGDHEIA